MALVRVRALKPHEYEAVPRQKDEIYEVDEAAVPELTANGDVQVLTPEPPKPGRAYKRRDMRPSE